MRIYDPRVARFLSVDPISKSYPELSPYQFASNRPIDGIDLDGLEYLWYNSNNKYLVSLYRLHIYEDNPTHYTLSAHIWVTNSAAHRVIMNHPDNVTQQEAIDDQVPEVKTFKGKKKNTRMHNAYNKKQAKNANRSARGDIAGGIIDLIKWIQKTSYEINHKEEISYGQLSLQSLDQADKLMGAASNTIGFPELLKNDHIRKALVNYMTDGYLDKENFAFNDVIEKWGNLIFQNREKILKGDYVFLPKVVIPRLFNPGSGDMTYYKIFDEVKENLSTELKEARELLETKSIIIRNIPNQAIKN